MNFYCPNCQQDFIQDSQSVVTTKLGQQYAKAICPACNTDAAAKITPQSPESAQTNMSVDEQAVLKEFSTVS